MKPPCVPATVYPPVNASTLQADVHACLQSQQYIPPQARQLLEECFLALTWLDIYQRLYGEDPDTLAYAQFLIHEERTP